MTPRIQAMVAALAVLLVGMGAVLVLVGDAGVQTSVYSADATATPLPTATPTPIPGITADDWVPSETETDVWQYQEDGTVLAQFQREEVSLETLVADYASAPLPEDVEYPALEALHQLRATFELQLGSLDDNENVSFDGPRIELVGGVPVVLAHITYGPGFSPQNPEGVNYAVALIEQEDEQYVRLQYLQDGPSDDHLFQGFMTWIAENAPDLAQPEAAEGDTGETDADQAGTDATPAPTSEAADAEVEATPAPPTEPAGDDAEAPTAPTGEAVDDESDATPAPTTEAAGDDTEASAPPTETWIEMSPGQVFYAVNPEANASIMHGPGDRASLLDNLGIDPESEDAPSTVEEILIALKADIENSIEQSDMAVGEDASIEGPVFTTIGDVALAYLELVVEASTDPNGQPVPRQTLYQYLIDQGDGNLYFVQFSYMGDPDPVLEVDFQTWLVENVPDFAEAEPTAE